MNDVELAEKLTKYGEEIKSLKHRVTNLEGKQEAINDLAISVNKLAINMQYMVDEQKQQGERLKNLESEPLENTRYYKRLIIGGIITTVIGAIIGALIALIF